MSRKTAYAALLLTLGLIAGAGSPALAQDPGIGVDVDVSYVDPEGALAGLVTVREIEDPFTGFREDSPPAEDTRFVQLTVAFEAADDMPFEAHPSHILLQDTDGFLWSYTTISRAPDAKPKELESQALEAGDRVSGAIDFVVPASAVIDEVLYQPSSGGRLITVADLTATEPAPVAEECDGVEAWLTATIDRLDRATALSQEDAAMDPAGFAAHQPEYAALAAAQAGDSVPALAKPTHDLIVGALEGYAAALKLILELDPESDDTALVLVEAVNTFNASGSSIQDARGQIAELASSCGVAI